MFFSFHSNDEQPHYLKTDFNKWKDEDDSGSDSDGDIYGGGGGDLNAVCSLHFNHHTIVIPFVGADDAADGRIGRCRSSTSRLRSK